MTIEIYCECGQQILAQDQYAGRKVRCSGCERILRLPKPDQSPEEKPPLVVKPEVRQERVPAPTPDYKPAPPPAQKPASVPLSEPIPAAKTMSSTLRTGIPEAPPEAAPPEAAPSVAKPPATDEQFIEFSCLCGEDYRAQREHAGEPTKCPHCGDILFIPNVA